MIELVARLGDKDRQVTVEPLGDSRYRVVIDGHERILSARRGDGSVWLVLGDAEGAQPVKRIDVDTDKHGDPVIELGGVQLGLKLLDPLRVRLEKAQAVASRGRVITGPEVVRTPMPGKLVKLLVKVGEAITAGQGVAVVEAMKMENELRATRAGKVSKLDASEGQVLEAQAAILEIE
jgi:biotin carboxyl carrier protein